MLLEVFSLSAGKLGHARLSFQVSTQSRGGMSASQSELRILSHVSSRRGFRLPLSLSSFFFTFPPYHHNSFSPA